MTSAPGRDPRLGRSAGVTLVELMVVLVFVAVGVLALSGVQTRSQKDVYTTGRRSRALALAQSQMELARSAGFSLVQADSGQAGGFNWWTRVDSVAVDMRHVNVTVTWAENGAQRSVQLDNLMASR